jgi:hypothetical protein
MNRVIIETIDLSDEARHHLLVVVAEELASNQRLASLLRDLNVRHFEVRDDEPTSTRVLPAFTVHPGWPSTVEPTRPVRPPFCAAEPHTS